MPFYFVGETSYNDFSINFNFKTSNMAKHAHITRAHYNILLFIAACVFPPINPTFPACIHIPGLRAFRKLYAIFWRAIDKKRQTFEAEK